MTKLHLHHKGTVALPTNRFAVRKTANAAVTADRSRDERYRALKVQGGCKDGLGMKTPKYFFSYRAKLAKSREEENSFFN